MGSVANQSAAFVIAASRFILKLDRNTELARGVDVMMARAKIIYIFMIKVNKLIFFFVLRYFLKEIENMFSVFQSSYSCVPTAFLVLPNFHFIKQLD